jgi:hypothetical protein
MMAADVTGAGEPLPDSTQPAEGSETAASGTGRQSATTAGAPYPPAQTQGSGPSRRAPRVPSAEPTNESREGPDDA